MATTGLTRIVLQRMLGYEDFDGFNVLKVGDLLKDMDIGTCMSAESLTKMSCVTRTMDDLLFDDLTDVKVGDILIVRSQVNRAFNTSMECGVTADIERDGVTRRLCSSYFVYVALDPSNKSKPAKVPPVEPDRPSDQVRWALAADRREIRLNRSAIEEDVTRNAADLRYSVAMPSSKTNATTNNSNSSQANAKPKPSSPNSSASDLHNMPKLPPRKDMHAVTRMVLPPHCNHMGNTFGGQIMAWCVEFAQIVAYRHCQGIKVVIAAIDDVFFLAPSSVGHRVVLKSRVNRVFNRSLEVGVRVEGVKLDGEVSLIARCYITFVADKARASNGTGLNNNNSPSKIPTIPEFSLANSSPSQQHQQAKVPQLSNLSLADKSKKGLSSWVGGATKKKSEIDMTTAASAASASELKADDENKINVKNILEDDYKYGSPTPNGNGPNTDVTALPQVSLTTEDDKRRHLKALGRRRIRLERLVLRGRNAADGKLVAWQYPPDGTKSKNEIRELVHENLRSLARAARGD